MFSFGFVAYILRAKARSTIYGYKEGLETETSVTRAQCLQNTMFQRSHISLTTFHLRVTVDICGKAQFLFEISMSPYVH